MWLKISGEAVAFRYELTLVRDKEEGKIGSGGCANGGRQKNKDCSH